MARQQLHLFADHFLLLIHHRQTKGSPDVRTDAESKIVAGTTTRWKDDRWLAQANDDLSTRNWQRFPGADVERDALPAPGINVQLQRGECFNLRIGGHAVFVLVTTKLTANKILCLQRPNSLQNLNFFVAYRFTIGSDRWFHRQVRQDLEQVVLNHVANRAGLVVECPPALNSEVFGHGYLHALDLIAVPERLQNCILEPQKNHVTHRSFPQVMIDAKDVLLVESTEQNPIELLRRDEVVTEGLFNDDTSTI